MVSVLFVIVFLLTVFSYRTGRGSLVLPSFIVGAVFALATFYYTINLSFIGEDISFLTSFVIISGLLSWIIGENVAKTATTKNKVYREITTPVVISNKLVYAGCMISLFVTIVNYNYFKSVGQYLGGNNILAYYSLVRGYLNDLNSEVSFTDDFNKPRIAKLLECYVIAQNYLLIYYYYYNNIIAKKKGFKKYVLPFVIYSPSLFFSTARAAFVEPIAFLVVVPILMSYTNNRITKVNKKYIKYIFIIAIVSIALFKITGDIRGGAFLDNGSGLSEGWNTINRDLCIYIASPIKGLDLFLSNIHEENSAVFGGYTLSGIYDILRFLGINIESDNTIQQESFRFIGYNSNVYTGFKAAIIDFSLVMHIPYCFIIGYVCGLFYYKMRTGNYKRNAVLGVVLGRLYYPIFMFFFTNTFVSYTGTLFFIFLFFLIITHKQIMKKSH